MPQTNATQPAKAPATVRRLGVGHFLVWMTGVSVVLAVYQASTDFSELNESVALRVRLMQLAYGLAYGTAISGLALFVWWRLRGIEMRPQQPGHWLLVLGGIGVLIDVGCDALTRALAQGTGMPGHMRFPLFQLLAWSLATALAILLVTRAKASAAWTAFAWLMLLVVVLNATAYAAALTGMVLGAAGMWPWLMPAYVRLIGPTICVPAILAAVALDHAQGRSRDWLHFGGIAAILALALTDLVIHVLLVLSV